MPPPDAMSPSDTERADLDAFWRCFQAQRDQLGVEVRDDMVEVLGRAIHDGTWEAYEEKLRQRGIELAHSGASFRDWFARVSAIRDQFRRYLQVVARMDLPTASAASRALDRVFSITLATMADAFIATKEQGIAASEERYRAMFERNPMPMWTFDRATLRFVDVNEAAVRHYGYSREELATMTLADIRASEDVEALRADVRRAHGLAAPRTWKHRKKDGTFIEVEIVAHDFTVDDGRELRLVLIHDVTERVEAARRLREAEEQLHRAQKMEAIGRLAGSIAHDFNNVLSVIGTYAELVDETLDDAHEVKADVVEIRRATERASQITRQLLAVSRNSVLDPRPVDLAALVEGVGGLLRRLLGETIDLVVRSDAVPMVIADPGRIEQVLMNLAVNARDAMPDGGRLTIETSIETLDDEAAALRQMAGGTYVVLAVTDTGSGMDEATQARIFDPFFTTKEPGKGTGLGLAIVHGIVAQAGGTVTVYSEPGHGSTFRVYLPIADAAVAVTEPVRVEPPRTLPPSTVLVVDDNAELRRAAARILSDAGANVLEASTGSEALRVCVAHPAAIDVVVLDVVLPDTRGDTLLHRIRELRPSTAVVLMSGYPAGASTRHADVLRDLLPKPFTPASLRAAVARVLGERAASAPVATRSRTDAQRTRALVADDDEHLRRVLRRKLVKEGFEVVEAATGDAAISELSRASFDVVLSDIQMPGATGLDLMRAIRRIDLDIPIVLMSGSPDLQTATAAIEYGAFRYLSKPLEIDALPGLLRHAARAHALARLRRQALETTGRGPLIADRAGLEVRFEGALEQLYLAYQPIFEARSGRRFGIEALVRSREPTMTSPVALLDAATQLGRLSQIGRAVRSTAAMALADRSELALFVNLHPEDLLDVDLIDEHAPLSRIAPRVILEVTERASLAMSPELVQRIARLRELGFRIAVDDIGAGYSGLTTYAELLPEIVKIDMSLVRNVQLSAVKQQTIAALCRLCHETGTLVVAEGIETADEHDCVVGLGCDLLQGYLLGRPEDALPAR